MRTPVQTKAGDHLLLILFRDCFYNGLRLSVLSLFFQNTRQENIQHFVICTLSLALLLVSTHSLPDKHLCFWIISFVIIVIHEKIVEQNTKVINLPKLIGETLGVIVAMNGI